MLTNQNNNFDIIVGIEVHAQLQTQQKIFSNENMYYKKKPNNYANLIDKSFPGTLPLLNKKAIELAIKFGKLTKSKISKSITFDRKHYFYPDLPKGYQITQQRFPIVQNGMLSITCGNNKKNIRIKQAHLEEDTGKLLYNKSTKYTALDLNRAGVALLEIVTEPTLTTVECVILYLRKLHTLLRKNNICAGKLEAGEFRCDINVSLKKKTDHILRNKVEIKNLNSFKCVENAIKHEILRQSKIYKSITPYVKAETRLFDKKKNLTIVLRDKELQNEYKYTEEPNLPYVELTKKNLLSTARKQKEYRKKNIEVNRTLQLITTKKHTTTLKFIKYTKSVVEKIILQNKNVIPVYTQRKKNVLNYLVGCYTKTADKNSTENLHYVKALFENVLNNLTKN